VEDGPRLKFRHEIARLAAEQAIRAHRRGAIHARILAALRTLGCEDDARMAFHAEGAGEGEAVLRYATSAARRAAALASHREAAAQCRGADALAAAESALATLEPLGPSPELAWAVANLAGQRMLEGENSVAIELARRAQSTARALGVPEVLGLAGAV
jgi:hypothetical protein